jgi:hypothetical protein
MLAEPSLTKLSESEFLRVAKYLPYRDVLRLLSTSKIYQHYRGSEELSHLLLREHLGVDPAKTPLNFEQYYQKVMTIVRCLSEKYTRFQEPGGKSLIEILDRLFGFFK